MLFRSDPDRTEQILKNFLRSEWALVPLTNGRARGDYWAAVEKELTFDADMHLLVPGMIIDKQHTVGDRPWFDPYAAFRIRCDYIERRGTSILIIDEKTGFSEPDPFQLEIAQHLAMRGFHPLEMSGIWHVEGIFNVLSGYKPKSVRLPALSANEAGKLGDKIKELLAEVNTWPEKYGESGYPANPCGLCGNCSVPTCPIGKEIAVALSNAPGAPVFTLPESLTSAEEAQRAVVFVAFTDRLQKQIKDLLQSYVDKNGRVAAGGMAAEYYDVESCQIDDMGSFIDLVIAYGAKPEQILDALTINKTEFEHLVKKANLTERLPMINQLVKTSTSRRFYVRKDKGKEVKQITEDAAA